MPRAIQKGNNSTFSLYCVLYYICFASIYSMGSGWVCWCASCEVVVGAVSIYSYNSFFSSVSLCHTPWTVTHTHTTQPLYSTWIMFASVHGANVWFGSTENRLAFSEKTGNSICIDNRAANARTRTHTHMYWMPRTYEENARSTLRNGKGMVGHK